MKEQAVFWLPVIQKSINLSMWKRGSCQGRQSYYCKPISLDDPASFLLRSDMVVLCEISTIVHRKIRAVLWWKSQPPQSSITQLLTNPFIFPRVLLFVFISLYSLWKGVKPYVRLLPLATSSEWKNSKMFLLSCIIPPGNIYTFFILFLGCSLGAFYPSAFLVCQAEAKVGNGVCVDRVHHQLVSAFFIG